MKRFRLKCLFGFHRWIKVGKRLGADYQCPNCLKVKTDFALKVKERLEKGTK